MNEHQDLHYTYKDSFEAPVTLLEPSKIDPSLDGELVYANALATTSEILEDPDFGVKANAINMVRKVEFYQWEEEATSETHDKLGGSQETTTTYTYKVGWSRTPINSAEFKDPSYKNKNTVLANVEKGEWSATNVSFGAYELPEFIIRLQKHLTLRFQRMPSSSGRRILILMLRV